LKIAEITTKKFNIPVYISNEEHAFLSKLNKEKKILKSDLTEREVVLATELVKKSVITRVQENGKIVYQSKE